MANEDEFYDEATNEFPDKEDFENRLVAIWPTGKRGTRTGENGQEYPWVETYTMALDNGPDGADLPEFKNEKDKTPYLVGPAPAVAENIQWSATGVYSRVAPRINKTDDAGNPDYRPVIGRINRRKNAKKGLADSWSLGAPSEADRVTVREHVDQIKAMTAKVGHERQAAADAEAFTS